MVKVSKTKKRKPAIRTSPFKLWDSFQKEDKEIFFGRDRESQLLYEKTFASNLLLLYGVSGTGKTSLIQCGLGNEFEDSEWLPIFIRKGDNIIKSLSLALRKQAKDEKKQRNNSIREKIHQLFLEQFRPVFLIFDQFEELFILGSRDEQISFFTLLPDLLAANFQCKVILSIREDYLACLDEFEDYVPGLFYNRLRLEQMRKEQLEEVIRGTSGKLGIQLGSGAAEEEQQIVDDIITNVENDFDRVDLADLQVYLDHLHKKDQIRQRKLKKNRKNILFDSDLVKKAGELEDVLGELLAEQLVSLEDLLEENGARSRGIPKSVLAELVTNEGTKLAMNVDKIKDKLKISDKIDPDLVDICIDHLLEIRILKDHKKTANKTIEIAHDRLAKKIYSLIGGEKQKEKEISQEIRNAFNSFQTRGALLDQEDLTYFQPYLKKIVLTADERAFVERSQRDLRRQGARTRLLSLSVMAILAMSVIFAIWHWRKSALLSITNDLSAAALHAGSFDRTKAFNLAKKALEIEANNQLANTLMNDILIESNTFPFYAEILKGKGIEKFSDIDVTSDKKYLAAGSLDGKILFYDLNSFQSDRATVFKSHHSMITDVDFSQTSDGKNWLLTSGKDGKVLACLLENGKLKPYREFCHKKNPVLMVDLSDDLLFSGTPDYIFKWDFKYGTIIDSFALRQPTCFEFIKNRELLITASRDSIIRIIDINQKSKRFPEIKISDGIIENMDIIALKGKSLLAAGLENGNLLIFELDNKFFTGNYDPTHYRNKQTYEAHDDAIKDVNLIKDDNNRITILTSSRDKTAKLWSWDQDELVLLKTFLGHNDGLRAISHVRDGQKDIIFTGGEDRTIKKWIIKPYPFQTLPGLGQTSKASVFANTYGGKRILVAKENEPLVLFRYGQTYSGDFALEDIDPLRIEKIKFPKMAFSSSGDTMLIPSKAEPGAIEIIEIIGTSTRRFSRDGNEEILGIDYTAEEPKALLSNGQMFYFWNLHTNLFSDSITQEYPVDLAFFSPDGNTIMMTEKDQDFVYWLDVKNKKTGILTDHTDEVLSVAFSTEEGYILTGSKDNRVMLYQKKDTIERISSFQRHADNVNSVAFSPSGAQFLSASEDGTLRLWQTKERKEIKSFINLSKPIVKAAFLTEEKIITLDQEGKVKIWNSEFVKSPEFNSNIYDLEKTYKDYLEGQ